MRLEIDRVDAVVHHHTAQLIELRLVLFAPFDHLLTDVATARELLKELALFGEHVGLNGQRERVRLDVVEEELTDRFSHGLHRIVGDVARQLFTGIGVELLERCLLRAILPPEFERGLDRVGGLVAERFQRFDLLLCGQ